jgi:aspartyl-tRNA(Asn)/glutamyl-tRNA(Gln) amidotransferase subunit A
MAPDDRPLHALTLIDMARSLRARRATALQLVEACLDRIESREGEIHAVATRCVERALQEATVMTRRHNAGKWLSLLDGLPVLHKDVFLTRGVRSTANSRVLADWVPNRDAALVRLFSACGTVMLGKTVCHEFAFGAPAPDDLFPPARNPWDPLRMPGSSSSGSGAALAAGYGALATGTDTGGSVRHPAAACGLVGLKPTRGLFSTAGVIALAPSLDTVGWLTRSVADQQLVWAAMTGSPSASEQAAWLDRASPGPGDLEGVRIGVPRDWLDPDSELSAMHDPQIRAAFEQARDLLRSCGVHWVPVDLPPITEIIRAAHQIICTEAAQQVGRWLYSGGPLGQGLRRRLERSGAEDLEAYHRALLDADHWRSLLDRLFSEARIDLLASPGREHFPESIESLMASGSGPRTVCNRLYSLTGHPALTLPMGLASNGLPMAVQFAAPRHAEGALLDRASLFERAGLALPPDAPLPWR